VGERASGRVGDTLAKKWRETWVQE
jgi:hypothetical protein